MKALKVKKTLFPVTAILIGLFVLCGCLKMHTVDIKPIPPEVIPKNATVSIYFDAKGDLVMVDKDGNPIKSHPIPFPSLLNNADTKESGWIKLLGSYSLFKINENSQIWLCDKELQCVETQVKLKSRKAIFGLSYNSDTGNVFISDTKGEMVEMVAKDIAAATDKSQYPKTMGTKMGRGKLRAFTDLIESTDFSSVKEIRMIRSFMLFKVKGSHMFADFDPNTGSVSFACIDYRGHTCAPTSPTTCPPDLCEQN